MCWSIQGYLICQTVHNACLKWQFHLKGKEYLRNYWDSKKQGYCQLVCQFWPLLRFGEGMKGSTYISCYPHFSNNYCCEEGCHLDHLRKVKSILNVFSMKVPVDRSRNYANNAEWIGKKSDDLECWEGYPLITPTCNKSLSQNFDPHLRDIDWVAIFFASQIPIRLP